MKDDRYRRDLFAGYEQNRSLRLAAERAKDARILKAKRDNPEMNCVQLAERFGCSKQKVENALKRMGWAA